MKTLSLVAIVGCVFLFSQCKTAQTVAPQSPAPSLHAVQTVLDTTWSTFLAYADTMNGNPRAAIMQTAAWLRTQPLVSTATVTDSLYIRIRMKSGLITGFDVDLVDSAGYSLFRGGGGNRTSSTPHPMFPITTSNNTITNTKALWYSAANADFYTPASNIQVVNEFTNAPVKLDVTYLADAECTYQKIQTFKDYGLVIIDGHGNKDQFIIGQYLTFNGMPADDDALEATIVKQIGQDGYDKLINGELRLSAGIKVNEFIPFWQKHIPPDAKKGSTLWATSRLIDNLPDMPNTVIYGNMCFSGNQSSEGLDGFTPIKTAFTQKHPISYYAFAFDDGTSEKVSNGFGTAMLLTLLNALLVRTDSTGIANLSPAKTEFADPANVNRQLLFKHFGADDYSYKKCGDPFMDMRDSQVYKTVCLGTQVWMAQNLNYDVTGGTCYNNSQTLCATYGKLYDWNTLMAGAAATDAYPSGVRGICPKGWHVPSVAEFKTLESFLGGTDVSGGAMKTTTSLWNAPNIGATNSSGFSALPAGLNNRAYAPPFVDIGNVAQFWTTTNDASNTPQFYWLTTNSAAGKIQSLQSAGVNYGMSCRCVQDK